MKKIITVLCCSIILSASAQQKEKQTINITKEPSTTHLLKNDFSDTLYTYLDEYNNPMHHTDFWIKLSSEMYKLKTIKEKNKQTIKQLEQDIHHKLIDTPFNFDSLDYSFTNKRASDYKGKKVVLVVFWTGCGGCILLDRDLKLLEKEYPTITFVHLTASWKKLAAYKQKYNMGDIILLPDNYDPSFVKIYNDGAPLSLFINEKSEIKKIQLGFIGYDFLKKAYLEKLNKL